MRCFGLIGHKKRQSYIADIKRTNSNADQAAAAVAFSLSSLSNLQTCACSLRCNFNIGATAKPDDEGTIATPHFVVFIHGERDLSSLPCLGGELCRSR